MLPPAGGSMFMRVVPCPSMASAMAWGHDILPGRTKTKVGFWRLVGPHSDGPLLSFHSAQCLLFTTPCCCLALLACSALPAEPANAVVLACPAPAYPGPLYICAVLELLWPSCPQHPGLAPTVFSLLEDTDAAQLARSDSGCSRCLPINPSSPVRMLKQQGVVIAAGLPPWEQLGWSGSTGTGTGLC